jgi:hypothetical protein
MKRRDFLVTGILTAGALAAQRIRGTPTPTPRKRGAVVIGVNKVGELPMLKAAVAGASSVADWLKREGFEVKLFVDKDAPVEVEPLKRAIKGFIDPGTLDQLVVYFAGHGCITGALSEMWLLSGAPDDPDAAILLNECCTAARSSAIPNVVFISDACRSRANSLGVERIQGSVIFPNRNPGHGHPVDVDQFLATRVGAAAWEYTVEESTAAFQGIFTECFLNAFKHPYSAMVDTVSGERIIPNRRLKKYLAKEVPKRAREVKITLEQDPDSLVLSDEPTYIGHAPAPDQEESSQDIKGSPTPVITASLSDVAKVILNARGLDIGSSTVFSGSDVTGVAEKSGFNNAIQDVHARRSPAELEVRTGFTVSGARLESAVTSPGTKATIRNAGDESLVDVDLRDKRAASVALRFANGSGTVVAALDTYIGNVAVVEGKVATVNYIPSRANDLRSVYESEREQLEALRAAVATAARFGVFRFEGPKRSRQEAARRMAEKVRMLKGIDPTLGLYATYAYAEADLKDQVLSVKGFMRETLGVDLFDVGMLAEALPRNIWQHEVDRGSSPHPAMPREFGVESKVVPFCPMLSQGWGQLRVRNVPIPAECVTMRDHLQVSLWMTLDKDGMENAETILKSGRVI